MQIISTKGMRLCAVASAVAIAAACASAQEIIVPANADAGIREDGPETNFGTTTPTELTVRVTSGQNRHSLVRFNLAGLTAADLQGFADIRITHRGNGLGNGNAGGVKFYGLNPVNPLNATWNEATVHYRDAGSHGAPQPSPTAQPLPGALPNPPVSPIFVNSPSDYGALVTGAGGGQNANGAPGIRNETPPYSPNVNNLNVTRFNANTAVFNAGTGSYQAYSNQPGYMQTTASGDFSDLLTAGFPLPGATVGNDFEDYTFLGNLNYDAKTRAAGSVLSFTTAIDNSPVNFGESVQTANRLALVNFLTNLLNGGFTSATFMIVEKNAVDADPLPVRADNLIFASKEFQPTGGFVGQWTPFMIVAPEPGSMMLAAAGVSATLLRRRRA